MERRETLSGAVVWCLAGIALLTYASIGLMNTDVPGVEELVAFINRAEGWYLYLGAFLTIFLEGLYFFGSFFPGSTLVLLIAITAQAGGPAQFLGVIGTIYVGWITTGICNMLGARYARGFFRVSTEERAALEDNAGMTWFPAFRANMEVEQISDGYPFATVFFSSVRVKTYACVGAALYALLIPLLVDFQEMRNEEGFTGLFIIAGINFGVAGYKLYQYQKQQTQR